jgi:hypothetical protein
MQDKAHLHHRLVRHVGARVPRGVVLIALTLAAWGIMLLVGWGAFALLAPGT